MSPAVAAGEFGEAELTDSGERDACRPRSGVSERDARDMLAAGSPVWGQVQRRVRP